MAILSDGEAMVVLRGETDPERKRKTIGRLFFEVFEEEAGKLEGVRWLAQGTIKSHHNVGYTLRTAVS